MQNMHSHFADARDHENINRYSETDDMNSLLLGLAFKFGINRASDNCLVDGSEFKVESALSSRDSRRFRT